MSITNNTSTNEFAVYIAENGSDSNQGTFEFPFASIERAIDEIKKHTIPVADESVTVYFREGSYKINPIVLDGTTNGTKENKVTFKSYNSENVILTTGISVSSNSFTKTTDKEILSRLDIKAREHILVLDLKAVGVTNEMLGDTSFKQPNHMELFCGNERAELARYPNSKDRRYNKIVDVVKLDESMEGEKIKGHTIYVSDDMKERLSHWSKLEEALVYGKFYWEWADDMAKIASVDAENGTISFTSDVKFRPDGKYFVYNVLEELDSENEYYIDRDKMLLYYYPPKDFEQKELMLTVSENTILSGKGVNNVVFSGLSFTGTKGRAVLIQGNNLLFEGCKVYDIGGHAIRLEGTNNVVRDCEIFHIGQSGVELVGGSMQTLERGNCSVYNCYIHHFAERCPVYQNGARVQGVGNSVSHCEIAYSSHTALCYYGNYHAIEYNYVHDMVQDVSDGGALYIGGTMGCFGSVIRHNRFENIGNEEYRASAIYFDDGMAGQTAYGNLIINCFGPGFLIGGGHNHRVYNNLILKTTTPLFYDARFTPDGWHPVVKLDKPGTGIVGTLNQFPYREEFYQKAFPYFAKVVTDFSDYENPYFPANPSFSEVFGNICDSVRVMDVFEPLVKKYSSVEECHQADSCDIDSDFRIDEAFIKKNNIKWEQIQTDKIGRIK